jgi:hypothetical protein
MTAGDVNYKFLAGGSTATSAAGAHNIFGNFGGLSNVSAGEVLLLVISSSGGDMRISLNPTAGATNDTSLRLFNSTCNFDLPPMTVANASQLTMSREGTNNPVINWLAMVRVP